MRSLARSLTGRRRRRPRSPRTPRTPRRSPAVSPWTPPLRAPPQTPPARVPFHGFVDSPSTAGHGSPSPPGAGLILGRNLSPRPPSPAHARGRHGRTLADYPGVILDWCRLAVTLVPPGPRAPPPSFLDDFRSVLSAERVLHRALPATHPLHKSTVELRSADDMHRLACKLPRRLHVVATEP